ncbi:MAG: glucosaminidase domain-containing protein [Enterococcus sp.]
MFGYRTRSERRQAKKDLSFSINKKNIVPLLGTGLVAVPGALALMPTQVAAAEDTTSTSSVANFINQIAPSATSVANANDLYASVMIAQALLESGNGTSQLASAPNYNLFGVKEYGSGPAVYMTTQEYLNGQWVTMNEPFRQYSSYWESFEHQAYVLRSTSFSTGTSHYSGVWKSNTSSYQDATAYLTGRYATDPSYNLKLNDLIQRYNLTQYDTPASGYSQTTTETSTSTPTTTTQTTNTTSTTSSASLTGGTYTVASGDTLWAIANAHGLSVDQLMAANGLTSETVMVGQTLSV